MIYRPVVPTCTKRISKFVTTLIHTINQIIDLDFNFGCCLFVYWLLFFCFVILNGVVAYWLGHRTCNQ